MTNKAKSDKPEMDLMGRFIDAKTVKGQFFAEVPVGESTKRIDLICVEGDFAWPVRGKPAPLLDIVRKGIHLLGKPRSQYGIRITGVDLRSKDAVPRGAVALNTRGIGTLSVCAAGHLC